ncbi:hypothetical protein D3C86_1429930 [compost metagenome]
MRKKIFQLHPVGHFTTPAYKGNIGQYGLLVHASEDYIRAETLRMRIHFLHQLCFIKNNIGIQYKPLISIPLNTFSQSFFHVEKIDRAYKCLCSILCIQGFGSLRYHFLCSVLQQFLFHHRYKGSFQTGIIGIQHDNTEKAQQLIDQDTGSLRNSMSAAISCTDNTFECLLLHTCRAQHAKQFSDQFLQIIGMHTAYSTGLCRIPAVAFTLVAEYTQLIQVIIF